MGTTSFQEFALYDVALTPAQILEQYNEGIGGGTNTGTASATVEMVVYALGNTSAAFRMAVGVAEGSASAPMRLEVFDVGAVTAPVTISVAHPTGQAIAPISVVVFGTAACSAPVTVHVVPPGSYATPIAKWRPVVVLDGIDVSARLTGDINVEAVEGEARIADVSLLPTDADILPLRWVGKTITIDYATMDSSGAALYPVRLFTGSVDTPEIDLGTRVMRLRCTDNLQGYVARLSSAAVDALLPGSFYSEAVSGVPEDSWEYAQARAGTLAASLDASPYLAFRLTSWEAKVTPDYTYTDADIEDGSVAVTFASRGDIRNRIDCIFTHRFPRLKRRVIRSRWEHVGRERYDSPEAILEHGLSVPTTAMIEEALRTTGWDVVGDVAWVYPPPGPLTISYAGGLAVWVCTDLDVGSSTPVTTSEGIRTGYNTWAAPDAPLIAKRLAFGYSALLQKRYAQTVDEVCTLTVINQPSIDALGVLAEEKRANMQVDWDAGKWESWRPQPKASDAEVSAAEPEPTPILDYPPVIGEVSLDYMPDTATDRTAAEAAMQALVAQAQARIWDSHRRTTVELTVPLAPGLDITHTVAISATRLSCKGKVRSVSHRMSIESGRAVTEMGIAISTAQATGLPAHSTPAAPAEVPDPGPGGDEVFEITQATHVGLRAFSEVLDEETMFGYFTNQPVPPDLSRAKYYVPTAPKYPIRFTVQTPEIAASSRDNATVSRSATYHAKVVEDSFTIP